MELHQLRYFVTVAETGNFTAAAERVGLTQPNLSKQIARLERELGVDLLVRWARGVALTSAGEALLPRARRILTLHDAAARELQVHRQEQGKHLRVGVPDAAHVAPVFEGLLGTFRVSQPNVRLTRVEVPWVRHPEALRQARIDVGFGYSVCSADHGPGVGSARLVEDPTDRALLSEHHALTGRNAVGSNDLRHLPVFLPSAFDLPAMRAHQLTALRDAGYPSPVAPQRASFADAVAGVAEGSGWMITSELVARDPPPGTATVRLRGVYLVTGYDVLWREGDARATVAALVEMAQAAFGREG